MGSKVSKSIMQRGEPRCFICGKTVDLERHHVMAGTANRKLSEKYGLHTVLDLHKTQGFSFDAGEKEEGFFRSEEDQEKFYASCSYGISNEK